MVLQSSGGSSREDDASISQNCQTNYVSSFSDGAPLLGGETKAVNRSKILLYVVLVFAATAIGTAAYTVTVTDELNIFEEEYMRYAKGILEYSEVKATSIFGETHSLSTTITSYALDAAKSWPNVTLPDFHIRASRAIELSGAELVAFAPIVTKAERLPWEDYAAFHQGWIREDLAFSKLKDFDPGRIPEMIYSYSEQEESNFSGVFMPLWQLGPVPTNASIIKFDLLTHPVLKKMLVEVIDTEDALLSEVVNLDFLLRYSFASIDGRARSFLLQPVFDGFLDSPNVVGIIVAVIPWDIFFRNFLPEGTSGLLVEIKGKCGKDFTYLIDGPNAKYVEGDLHDTMYNLYQDAKFSVQKDDGFTHCAYTKVVYPTKTFRSKYLTRKPALYTALVILIFFFTAMVLFLYDYAVQRRQNKVVDSAARTTAIVSSLFPINLHRRVMEEAERESRFRGEGSKAAAPRRRLKDSPHTEDDKFTVEAVKRLRKGPIADLFPQATVLFAEIVNFTSWSSRHGVQPFEVFTLLESIFSQFDELARRRGVCKVETVGNCYVAVVGLTANPRKNHVAVMARFACDCLYAFHNLTKKLELELGRDTKELGIRLGMNSGPVTAGILRNARRRFQIFGDVVNTTSRVQKCGEPNRIHASQTTADLLAEAGKAHWVTARKDLIDAKGKGKIQTYWVEPPLHLPASTSASSRSDTATTSPLDNSSNVES